MRWQRQLATGGQTLNVDGGVVTLTSELGAISDVSWWSDSQIGRFLSEHAVGGFDTRDMEMLRDRLKGRARPPFLLIEAQASASHADSLHDCVLEAVRASDLVLGTSTFTLESDSNRLVLKVYEPRCQSVLEVLAVLLRRISSKASDCEGFRWNHLGTADQGEPWDSPDDAVRLTSSLGFADPLQNTTVVRSSMFCWMNFIPLSISHQVGALRAIDF